MSNPLSNLLYIFQSEHYDRMRFLKFVYFNLNWFGLSNRGKIEWTLRAKLLMIGALGLLILALGSAFIHPSWTYPLVVFLWGYLLFPIFLIIADIIISPLVLWKKNKILSHARSIIDSSHIKIIGITGSYGKTTMKTLLESILKTKYKVMTFPGNINTDIGVANYICSHQTDIKNTDILIVEMGAYCLGEIRNICEVTPPDYSFLTAIAPVHLERFGSVKNIENAKFEIVEAAKQKAFINIDNEIIKNSELRTKHQAKIIDVKMGGKDFNYTDLPDFKGIAFEYKNDKYETQMIAHHILGMIGMVLELAEILDLSLEEKQKGVKNVPHVSHRLEVTKNYQTGVTVIDDSYNGNEAGFLSALETLSRAEGRKIVLTPGIVELGDIQKEVHTRLAHTYINQQIDMVLLINNSNTKIIKEVFAQENFQNYKIYETAKEAHEGLPSILEKGDTILFQNDLTDNYR